MNSIADEPPLTKPEIAAWVENMGSTDAERIKTIRELLKCKVKDQMSRQDEAICWQELRKLELKHGQTSYNKDSRSRTKAKASAARNYPASSDAAG